MKPIPEENMISKIAIEQVQRSAIGDWPSTRARRVLAALERLGWRVKRKTGSHRVLARDGWANVVFAFGDGEEVGPRMLARVGRSTGLTPYDL